jgi:tetratricopeptide (TPR) repeat protein
MVVLFAILLSPFFIFEIFSENSDDIIKEAKELQKSGNNKKALENFNKALYGKASVFLLENEFENAEKTFKIILQIESEHVPTLIGMGIILSEANQFDKSMEFFDKANQIEPNNVDVLVNKAVSLIKQKEDYQQIIELLNESLSIEKNHIQALQNKKIALKEMPTKKFDGIVQTEIRDKNKNLLGYVESDRIIITEFVPNNMFNLWISNNTANLVEETGKDVIIFVKGFKEYSIDSPLMRTGSAITWQEHMQGEDFEIPIISVRQHGSLNVEGDFMETTWQLVVPKDLITK